MRPFNDFKEAEEKRLKRIRLKSPMTPLLIECEQMGMISKEGHRCLGILVGRNNAGKILVDLKYFMNSVGKPGARTYEFFRESFMIDTLTPDREPEPLFQQA